MKKRLFVFFVILALVAGLLPVVSAQDNGMVQVNCLNLSTDDCTIVTTAMDNFSKINSLSPSFSLTEDFTGFDALMGAFGGAAPAAPAGGNGASAMMGAVMSASSVNIQGSGALVIDHSKMTKDAPYNGVAVSFDVTGSATFAGKTTPTNGGFVLVDGVVYWKDDTGAWKGVAIADMMQAMKNGGTMSMFGMPMNSDMMGMMGGMSSMMPGAAASPDATPEATPEIAGMKLQDLLQLPGFVSQKRLDDADMSGQKMSVFAFTGDLGVLLNSPDVQKGISDMLTKMMSGGAGGSDAQGPAGMMAVYIPVLLSSTTGTATVTRWIGDDQFVHQVSLDLNATIDLNGGATSSKVTPLPPITLKVNVTFSLDKINSTSAPTAPTGATMVTPADLMPTPEATPA